MIYKFPLNIKSDFIGYSTLLDFYEQTKSLFLEELILDFNDTKWIDANLSAVLGAILDELFWKLNTFKIEGLTPKLEDILARNNFLSMFGKERIDTYRTTIQYKKFPVNEKKYFSDYLINDLFSNKAMPNMSQKLKKAMIEKIYEIFENAEMHGRCNYVYSCGQHFITRKKLDFTIVNFGNTIQEEVSKFQERDVSSIDSIEWAIQDGTTTKINQSGGLGLYRIRQFLEINGGKFQILSANGFWQEKSKSVIKKELDFSFPGTIVNLEFNVDNNEYCLASEKIEEVSEDIF